MPVNARHIAAALPLDGKKRIIIDDHDLKDIITEVMDNHRLRAADYDKISERFWTGDALGTYKNLFSFLKKNVTYKVEGDSVQTSKSPGRLLHDGYGDCKHYASFINGVMSSLKRKGYNVGDIRFRFAGYNPADPFLHHVFAVMKHGYNEYWNDPVLSYFNEKKPYVLHRDQKADVMAIHRLSGTDAAVGNFWDDIKKGAQNTVDRLRHSQQVNQANLNKAVQEAKHNVSQGAKNTVAKVAPAVLKVVGVAPRNSFLLLLKINGFNIAHRLYDFIHSSAANKAELFNKWRSMGGDTGALERNINTGMAGYVKRQNMTLQQYNASKKFVGAFIEPGLMYNVPWLTITGMTDGKYIRNAIGVEPTSAAAIMTAAAAVIAALAPILKKAKWSDSDKAAADLTLATGQAALSNAAAMTPAGGTFMTGGVMLPNGQQTPMLTATVDTMADGTKVVTVNDSGEMQRQTGTFSESVKEAFDSVKTFVLDNKTPLLVGTTALVVYKSGLLNDIFKPSKKRRR